MLKWTIYLFLSVTLLSKAFGQDFDTAKIEEILGVKGSWNAEEGVFKVSFPRKDVKVSVNGWEMPPFMGLSAWAGFKKSGEGILVMGDLILFQDEVNPVMSVVLQNGISVTALHNHFFYDNPRVFFMHIEGLSDAETLATALAKSFEEVKKIRSLNPSIPTSFGGPPIPTKSSISQKMIEEIFQTKGQNQDGMIKISIGKTTDKGMSVSKDMGVNSGAAFAGTDENAVVDGDIAVLEDELEDVLVTLRNANINIVAIHNHMIQENPRIVFVHYWGRGPAKRLAESLKNLLSRSD